MNGIPDKETGSGVHARKRLGHRSQSPTGYGPNNSSRDRWILIVVIGVSLLLMAVMVLAEADRVFSGKNDFAAFYAGARLLDTSDLYNPERFRELTLEHAGIWSPEFGYIRPPFHAALVWPLSRLPYLTAYAIWEAALLLGFAGFIALWRPPSRLLTLTFCAMSVPAFFSLAHGQDVTLLLFVVGATVALHRRGRLLAAGLVFSLCAIKLHLFLLTPVLILARREWGFARGLLAGGGILTLISFLVAGFEWPAALYRSVTNPAYTPNVSSMPNLHAVADRLALGLPFEIALAVPLIAACYIVARRDSFSAALCCSIAGGLLLSYHAYLQDLTLLLPVGLYGVASARRPALRFASFLLLFPPVYFAHLRGYPGSLLITGLLLATVVLMVLDTFRIPRQEPAAPSPNES